MVFIKKIQYNSPVVLTFALISFLATLLGHLTEDRSTFLLFCVYRSPLTNPLTYVRMFTHAAGHADFNHFLNNFLLILLLGPILEERYGTKKMVFMILITAAVTGIINMAFFNTALLGASGVLFMFILLASFVNLKKGRVPITLILVLVIFIGREIYDGIYLNDNISQLSHIIGGFCGALLGFYMNKDILLNASED